MFNILSEKHTKEKKQVKHFDKNEKEQQQKNVRVTKAKCWWFMEWEIRFFFWEFDKVIRWNE